MKQLSLQLPLIIPSILLLALSLLVLNSVSTSAFYQQLIFVVLGGILFWTVSVLDYRLFTSLTWVWFIVVTILLIFTLIFGQATRGSTRWIDFGWFRFQPSEFAKPMLILFLAGLSKQWKKIIPWWSLLILLIPVTLIYIQPDLGSSLIVLALGVSLLWSMGYSPRILMGLLGVAILSSPLIWQIMKGYQRERILTFLDPTRDPLGTGYNSIQAMIAVGSGMFLGRGLGHGPQSQLKFLPERNTDFIFATIGEEFGFVGSLSLILVYGWLMWGLLRVAQGSDEIQGRLIALGAFVMLASQVAINIGMNLGLLPVTGITLPLVSAGGSSVLATLILIGLVNNIASGQIHSKPTLEIK